MDPRAINAPGVFFLCPDEQQPTGGISSIYRQVEILAAAGVNAYVLHTKPGFRCRWFESQAPVASAAFRPLTRRDLVVIPEVYGPNLHEIAPLTPYAIFDQSLSYVFNDWPLIAQRDASPHVTPFSSERLLGIVCVSDLCAEYMRWLAPNVRVERIRHGVAPLETTPLTSRTNIATFMPRRNDFHSREVINAVRMRVGDAYEFEALADLAHDEVIERLKESRIFLSFGGPEGFGLPVLEAMNAGCLVIGYHGYGGQELLTSETGVPVEFGDLPGFARACTQAIEEFETAPEDFQRIADCGKAYAQAHYNPVSQTESALAAWTSLIDAHPFAEGLRVGASQLAPLEEAAMIASDPRAVEIAGLTQTVSRLEVELEEFRHSEFAVREELRRIKESRWWRLTRPLRSARRYALGHKPPPSDSKSGGHLSP
jgi:hypothetical protein